MGFIPSSGTGGAVRQEGTGAQSCARAAPSPVPVHQLSINTELSGHRNPGDCDSVHAPSQLSERNFIQLCYSILTAER